MIGTARVLGLIPARGGSKGVPRKNLRTLGGKPLLQWTADSARASRYIDRLVLSTDDDEIADVGRSLGLEVPFRRPKAESSDEAAAFAVIDHALRALDDAFEYLVYLQPTSPFRLSSDIDGCLETLHQSTAHACVSVTASPAKPAWMFYVDRDSRLVPVATSSAPLRRQDLEAAYELNGAVYAVRVASYLHDRRFVTARTLAWVMPAERSVDLDEPGDFDYAEQLLIAADLSPHLHDSSHLPTKHVP